MRALQVGKYSNTIQDLVLPWSYQAGSGIIPLGAKEFFRRSCASARRHFPYENLTRKYPPKHPSYRPWYIKIGPYDENNSTNNWSSDVAIPIRMGQAGTIRLTQIAAYDKHGNVDRGRRAEPQPMLAGGASRARPGRPPAATGRSPRRSPLQRGSCAATRHRPQRRRCPSRAGAQDRLVDGERASAGVEAPVTEPCVRRLRAGCPLVDPGGWPPAGRLPGPASPAARRRGRGRPPARPGRGARAKASKAKWSGWFAFAVA